MLDEIRVACVQPTSCAERGANLERADLLVARAAATGADVILLPEKPNAIGAAETPKSAAETIEAGESVEAMRGWARRHGVILGGGSITEGRETRPARSRAGSTSPPPLGSATR